MRRLSVCLLLFTRQINGAGRQGNLILTIDIAPTILELAGYRKAARRQVRRDEHCPRLKKSRYSAARRVLDRIYTSGLVERKGFYGIRTSQFKLIEYLTEIENFTT